MRNLATFVLMVSAAACCFMSMSIAIAQTPAPQQSLEPSDSGGCVDDAVPRLCLMPDGMLGFQTCGESLWSICHPISPASSLPVSEPQPVAAPSWIVMVAIAVPYIALICLVGYGVLLLRRLLRRGR